MLHIEQAIVLRAITPYPFVQKLHTYVAPVLLQDRQNASLQAMQSFARA